MSKYSLVPNIGVVKTTPMDRALGRSLGIESSIVESEFTLPIHFDASYLNVFQDLLGDTFYTYYLNEPEFVNQDRLPYEYRISQMLLAWMAEQPDSQIAKTMTTSSAPASVAAAIFSWQSMMTDEAFESIRKALKRLSEIRDQLNSQKLQEKREEKNNQKSSGGEDESKEQQQQPQPQPQQEQSQQQPQPSDSQQQEQEQESDGGQQKESEKTKQEYDRLGKSIEESVKNMLDNPLASGAMRDTAKKSRKKMEEIANVAKAWGLEIGSMSVLDMTSILSLYNKNVYFIEKLAELIGRSEIASSSALQRVRESYIGTPTKINLTHDLSKVLPFESILLSDMTPRVIRTQQVLDWATQGLPGWIDESEGKTRGSFIAYVDGSGSMSGDRILVAKAVAFGLAKTLHEDRFEERAYTIKTFGTERDGFKSITENSKMDEIADWSVSMFGGGTNFDYCFSDSFDVLDEYEKKEIVGSDMVFITDGEAELSNENKKKWKKYSKKTGSRLIFILISQKGLDDKSYGDGIKEVGDIADMSMNIKPSDFLSNPESVIDKIMDVVAIQRKDEYLQ